MDGYVELEDAIRLDTGPASIPSGGKPQYVSTGSFKMGPKGLFYDEGGDEEQAWISDPFEILAATRDDAGASWGLMLRWRDPDHREHLWAMPRQLLYGDGAALCGELANRGLAVTPGAKRRSLLLAYLATVQPDGRVTCVNRTGWHGPDYRPVYVLPDRTIGDAETDKMVLQTKSAIRSPFEERGTLEDWKSGVAAACEGNSRMVFAISASLAGPLLWLTGTESGGFHFVGASSQGKTTALQVGASVWGKGDKGHFIKTWRGTSNGMEGIAATHSDAALEIGQAAASTVAESCYMLAQGVGKVRATRNGEGRQPAQWRVMILSSGELTVSAKIAEDRGKRVAAGQMIRLLDVPSDAGQGLGAFDVIPNGVPDAKTLSDRLKAAANATYGTVGPALIGMIADDPSAARQAVLGFATEWAATHCPASADGQVRRAADRFGLVAAAGEFATAWGLLPWMEGAASAAAGKMFADWIAMRGGVEPAEVSAGIAQVRRFIEAFGEARFAPLTGDDRIIPNRAGFRRGFDEAREWLVLPETWRTEIASGFDPGLLARTMVERGMMKVGKDSKPQVKTPIPNLGKPRVYVITAALFNEGGHD